MDWYLIMQNTSSSDSFLFFFFFSEILVGVLVYIERRKITLEANILESKSIESSLVLFFGFCTVPIGLAELLRGRTGKELENVIICNSFYYRPEQINLMHWNRGSLRTLCSYTSV